MDATLVLNAVIAGLLLGGFYAAISIGLTLAFGLLDMPHVAHPAFVVLGGFGAVLLGRLGLDPLLAGILLAPAFFVIGLLFYRFYYETFERRGEDAGLRGLAFFFGAAFIVEIALALTFGVDQQMVDAAYIGKSVRLGDLRLPMRMLVACGGALVLAGALAAYISFTFTGRAIKAVAQNTMALQLVGADPVQVKQWAFGLATASVAVSGSLLAIIGPIDPAIGRLYIGKVFAVVVLAGLGSIKGTIIAALILGVTESVVLSSFGSSWAPAVSFGLLLLVLAFRPNGLFGA